MEYSKEEREIITDIERLVRKFDSSRLRLAMVAYNKVADELSKDRDSDIKKIHIEINTMVENVKGLEKLVRILDKTINNDMHTVLSDIKSLKEAVNNLSKRV